MKGCKSGEREEHRLGVLTLGGVEEARYIHWQALCQTQPFLLHTNSDSSSCSSHLLQCLRSWLISQCVKSSARDPFLSSDKTHIFQLRPFSASAMIGKWCQNRSILLHRRPHLSPNLSTLASSPVRLRLHNLPHQTGCVMQVVFYPDSCARPCEMLQPSVCHVGDPQTAFMCSDSFLSCECLEYTPSEITQSAVLRCSTAFVQLQWFNLSFLHVQMPVLHEASQSETSHTAFHISTARQKPATRLCEAFSSLTR